MTVRVLSQSQKDLIVTWYKQKIYTVSQLAKQYKTSTRTIGRVLEEAGLATPVPRLKGEAYQAMQVLKAYNMNVEQLKRALAAPALTLENVQAFLRQCTPAQLDSLIPAAAKPQPITLDSVTTFLRQRTPEERSHLFYNIELLDVAEKRKAYKAYQEARQSDLGLATTTQGNTHAHTPT